MEALSQKSKNSKPATKNNTREWVRWSTTPHSEEEIRKAFFDNPNKICVSYVCRFSTLSEDFIRELIILSTGVFAKHEEFYTEDNINAVKEIMEIESVKERLEYQKNIRQFYKGKADKKFLADIEKINSPLKDRIDWWQIANYQKLSDDFKDEFKDRFKIKSDNEYIENSNR